MFFYFSFSFFFHIFCVFFFNRSRVEFLKCQKPMGQKVPLTGREGGWGRWGWPFLLGVGVGGGPAFSGCGCWPFQEWKRRKILKMKKGNEKKPKNKKKKKRNAKREAKKRMKIKKEKSRKLARRNQDLNPNSALASQVRQINKPQKSRSPPLLPPPPPQPPPPGWILPDLHGFYKWIFDACGGYSMTLLSKQPTTGEGSCLAWGGFGCHTVCLAPA